MDINEENVEYGGYDQANAVVLPSKKRETKINEQKATNVTRILSKKKRKELEKIIEKKKKKGDRSSLLERLANVQLSAADLRKLTSITSVQTRGKKNSGKAIVRKHAVDDVEDEDEQKRWSSIAGKTRKQRLALLNGFVIL